MTSPVLIQPGVYRPDGSGLFRVGQVAVLDLQLQAPSAPGGPVVLQLLEGRFFVQRILDAAGAVLAEVEAEPIDGRKVRFTLPVGAGLLPAGRKSVDLRYVVVELTAGGEDDVIERPFGVRLLRAGGGAAEFTAGGPLVVRYVGAPGRDLKQTLIDTGVLDEQATDDDAIAELRRPAVDAAAVMQAEVSTLLAEASVILVELEAFTDPAAGIISDSSNRVSGDASLTIRVSTENSGRVSGDASLSTRVSTENSGRVSGDASLTISMNDEVSSRVSGDLSLAAAFGGGGGFDATSITNRVSTEEISRASGDASLTTRVSTENSGRVSGDASLAVVDAALSTAISTEISQRVSGDASLAAAGGGGSTTALDLHYLSLFGSGADGNVTVSGALTLTRDMYYANLTCSGACAINTGGFRIFVSGTLDISAAPAGSIISNGLAGGNASGPTGGGIGAVLSSFAVPGATQGASGAAGATAAATAAAQTTSLHFMGGRGAPSGASGLGAGGAGAASVSTPALLGTTINRTMVDFPGVYRSNQPGQVGNPGGGDGVAGGGAGGGGPGSPGLCIFARIIARGSSSTAAIIQAKGGNGGNGGTPAGGNRGGGSGGGGAGGGCVYIVTTSLTGSTITNAVDVTGGDGGTGGNGTGTGAGAQGGGAGAPGRFILINAATQTVTDTLSAGGTVAGTVASGLTGGAGAVATLGRTNL